ncbi:MAG: methyltransferase domain-containing protein [Verrucomicrobiota bacterium]|nr:methyltransferase domain-containing protein [Verrucomicrobiota bacterium]
MSQLKEIRASLEVGFPEGALPEAFARFQGKQMRSIGALAEFPYEDGQFDVVMMQSGVVSAKAVREAHRVLRQDGRLLFTVPERTQKQNGYTLPDIYSIVRDGFDITEVTRPAWWFFGSRGRTISICATKKAWKMVTNTYRPYV